MLAHRLKHSCTALKDYAINLVWSWVFSCLSTEVHFIISQILLALFSWYMHFNVCRKNSVNFTKTVKHLTLWYASINSESSMDFPAYPFHLLIVYLYPLLLNENHSRKFVQNSQLSDEMWCCIVPKISGKRIMPSLSEKHKIRNVYLFHFECKITIFTCKPPKLY